MEPVRIALLGAGGRGMFAYGAYAEQNPHMVKFVAVAEPNRERRERFARIHGIPADRCFDDWQSLLSRPQMAEALLNATMDQTHVPSTLAAIDSGYDVLLEKPMATTPAACVRLVEAAEEAGRVLQICHVLRFTTFWGTLHDLLQQERLGRVINVDHRENVAFWHMAHSFVRGNWSSMETSAPMILAKCCHDMDILYWNLGSPVRRMSSFGRLSHFRADQAPPGAPYRCTDGCPHQETCPFYAPRLYLGVEGWPANAITLDTSMEGRLEALRKGPYGRCVYHCDNDVVDHQVINMELESDTTITFTMQGHSHNNVRTMRYDGTRATLRASEDTNEITIYDYLTGNKETIIPGNVAGGHGGGDTGVMNAFVSVMRSGGHDALTSARVSLESHLMAFAAEQARITGKIVQMDDYRRQLSLQSTEGMPLI